MDGREADCARFESESPSTGTEGSNPSPSAKPLSQGQRFKRDIHTGKMILNMKEASRLYNEENWGYARIAKHYGYSYSGVRKMMQAAGVEPIKGTGNKHTRKKPKKIKVMEGQ